MAGPSLAEPGQGGKEGGFHQGRVGPSPDGEL